MTTTDPTYIPNDALAEGLAAIAEHVQQWPYTGLEDLAASYGSEGFPVDWFDVLVQASLRLKPTEPGTPLDEITETPARNSDPATSHKAIHSLNATTSRGAVALAFYKSFVGYGEPGLTPKGATKRAKIEHHSSPWKRVSNLKDAGIIAPTGETKVGDRGRDVEVLCITAFGVAEVERLMPDEAAAVRASALVKS